jgi:flagellar M-ring protein FliF
MNSQLTQFSRQLADIWKQLGLNQRISIVFAGVVVLGSLLVLGFWSARVEYSLLYGKLDEAEAARVIAALDDAKVPYKIGRGGASILVPDDKVYATRMQLAGKGIPRGEGVGFEIFDKANFGISDFVQRANYSRAIQGELARTISQLDLVESARVMIVMPENRLLVDSHKKPTASVFVRVRGNAVLPPSAVNSIRFLVANSVEGLQAHHVSVVDNLGNVLSEQHEPDSVGGLSNHQLNAKRNFEQYLARKAEGMLENVLGPGQAVVRVSAELNWDTITRIEEKFDPESQVVRSSTLNDEDIDSATGSSGGVPGIPANVAADPNAASSPVNNNRTRKKVTNTQYEINRTTSNILQSAGGIRRISGAVFVAERFEGAGADRRPVPRSPEELEKLRRIVQSAIGVQDDGLTRRDQITLEEIPFNDQPAYGIARHLERQERKDFWVGLGQKLISPALAGLILFLFWRMFQKTKSEQIPIGVPLGESSEEHNGNGHSRPGSGTVTVEFLNQLIRENPANMSQAVRTWLDRGGKPPGK